MTALRFREIPRFREVPRRQSIERHETWLRLCMAFSAMLNLPSGFAPYGSTTELFDRIRSLITKYSGLSDEYSRLLTYSTFASHFVDCLQTVPCVVLHGCADAEAIALLRLLGWLCRHPVLLTDAGLSVPEYLRPTRLICQPHTSLEKLLAPLRLSGLLFPVKGRCVTSPVLQWFMSVTGN